MNNFINCNQDNQVFNGSKKEFIEELQVKDYDFYNRTQDYKCSFWDSNQEKLVKATLQIIVTQQKNIKYLMDGQIIRIDKVINRLEVLNNLEQIRYLQWLGQYNQNQNKVAKWSAVWKGDQLLEVGGYYSEDGLKQGFWKELSRNYSNENQVYECGEYINDQRNKQWKYIYDNKIIGGGVYNKQGQKIGKWVELDDEFQIQSQVTYSGEYMNGQKVGVWDILYKRMDQLERIGGGSYAYKKEGFDLNSKKVGIWIELTDGFSGKSQVIQYGEYKNGRKIGKWVIFWRKNQFQPFQQIGDGSYDDKPEDQDIRGSIKIGKWIEFTNCLDDCLVLYGGQYRSGKKVGRWDAFFLDEQIGGGSYEDKPGNEIKFGNWIELSEGFQIDREVTYNGEYQNGIKVGKWDTFYQDEQIGGGSYDKEQGQDNVINSIKIGKWIELSDYFGGGGQIISKGEYQDGQKFGRWDILYRRWRKDQFEEIGGGSYGYKQGHIALGSIKIGKWIELSPDFNSISQITFNGEYENGQKVGNWITLWRKNKFNRFKQIGGGQYDDNRIDGLLNQNKIGRWIELNDGYREGRRIKYEGDYKNGRKIGKWNTFFEKVLIGGGQYSDNSLDFQGSIKIGKWIELKNKFGNGYGDQQVIFVGEYKNGKKVGTWNEMIRDQNKQSGEFKTIKEVQYDY
ncbi:unnamed protein product [Paramecium primaurelia]|uniref:Uncharacterized protein n=1 Tax=Paramecium primaurelia TaxID=5886 RepID=A0A8S1NK71_PARPR|nr:unnamed protein product [Paramecium primaurelia]